MLGPGCSISSAMEMNTGHEYCRPLKHLRSCSVAVSTVIIPVQGQSDSALRGNPSLRLSDREPFLPHRLQDDVI